MSVDALHYSKVFTYLALSKALDTVSAGVEPSLDILGPRSLLRIRTVQETIHAKRLSELDIRLRLVRLLSLSIELNSLDEVGPELAMLSTTT